MLRNTSGRQQSKTPILSRNLIKIVRNRVFDCHLSSHWRQMAIKNTVSIDFDPRSSIVDSVFDCRLHGVRKWIENAKLDLSTELEYKAM